MLNSASLQVIPLVYGLVAPLPHWRRVSALGRAMCVLLKVYGSIPSKTRLVPPRELITDVVFPQWHAAVVREILEVDVSHESDPL